jgi:hypothetical protein
VDVGIDPRARPSPTHCGLTVELAEDEVGLLILDQPLSVGQLEGHVAGLAVDPLRAVLDGVLPLLLGRVLALKYISLKNIFHKVQFIH